MSFDIKSRFNKFIKYKYNEFNYYGLQFAIKIGSPLAFFIMWIMFVSLIGLIGSLIH